MLYQPDDPRYALHDVRFYLYHRQRELRRLGLSVSALMRYVASLVPLCSDALGRVAGDEWLDVMVAMRPATQCRAWTLSARPVSDPGLAILRQSIENHGPVVVPRGSLVVGLCGGFGPARARWRQDAVHEFPWPGGWRRLAEAGGAVQVETLWASPAPDAAAAGAWFRRPGIA
ncbi:MAG: hypothetical protein AB7Q15_19110 [Vicinamibacterales bacterium]